MSMNLYPLEDRVVVEPLEAEEKSPGGIYIPEKAKEKPRQGIVLAVGPGKVGEDGKVLMMAVDAGDEVLYGNWAGNDVKLNGKDVKILRESEILARVEHTGTS